MNNLFIFVGPSASGKTTTENILLNKVKGMRRFLISTTRARRKGEVHGKDYEFLSLENFKKEDFFHVIEITPEWLYGYSKAELNKIIMEVEKTYLLSLINIEPALQIKKYIEKNNLPINVFFIHFNIDRKTRKELLLKRGESIESIEKRFSREDNLKDFPDYKPDLTISSFENLLPNVLNFIIKKEIESSFDGNRNEDFFYLDSSKEVKTVISEFEEMGIWK
jgi:guanylate kinase